MQCRLPVLPVAAVLLITATLLSQHRSVRAIENCYASGGCDNEDSGVNDKKTALNPQEAAARLAANYTQYCVVGAGPAGLQMGHFLNRAGRDYATFERGARAGTFFNKVGLVFRGGAFRG